MNHNPLLNVLLDQLAELLQMTTPKNKSRITKSWGVRLGRVMFIKLLNPFQKKLAHRYIS